MENILFKISFPAEFHAQTAAEAAMVLHAELHARGKTAADIARLTIRTHEAAIRIIDKKGPLHNPADRDHCIQYMVAVPLILGRLQAEDYEDDVAAAPPIDGPRDMISWVGDPQFISDYRDPEELAMANALTVGLAEGTALPEVAIAYPIGHPRRREE